MGIATKIKSLTSCIDLYTGNTSFGPKTAAVIVKFKMAAHAKINDPMLSLLLLLGSLKCSYTDIWEKPISV